MWNDFTRQSLAINVGAASYPLVSYIPSIISTIKTTSTVALTTAGTYYSLFVAGNYTNTLTLPVNYFVAGKTIMIELMGTLTTTGAGTISIQPRFQTYSLGTATSAATLTTTTYNVYIKILITCQATGAAGTAKLNTTVYSTLITNAGVAVPGGCVAGTTSANVATNATGLLDVLITENTGAAASFNIYNGIVSSIN